MYIFLVKGSCYKRCKVSDFRERQKAKRKKAYIDFKKSLKDAKFDEPITMYIFRPVAFIFVKLFYKTKITPNIVSFIGIGLGVLGGIFLSAATTKSILAGVFLYFLAIIADNADGMLARLTGRGTPMGRIIDGVSDYAVGTAMYIGMLIAFSKGTLSTGFFNFHPFLVLAVSAVSMIAHLIAVDYYRGLFTAFALGKMELIEEEEKIFQNKISFLKSRNNHFFEKIIIILFSMYHSVQSRLSGKEKKMYNGKSYFQANRTLIMLWFWIGPAANALVLMISLVLFKPVIYLAYTIILGNVYMLVMLIIQNIVNARLETE